MKPRALLLCFGLMALSGCATSGNQSGVFDTVRATVQRIFTGNQPQVTADLRSQITPEAVAETETPLLFLEVMSRGADAVLTPTGQNGGVRTWATADAISLSLDRGVLTATRGFGPDLLSSNLTEVRQGIAGTRSQGARIHRYLDANEQIIIRSFVCNYTRTPGQIGQTLIARFSATLVTEDCIDPNQTNFINRYWIDGSGLIRKSEQWLGDDVGSLSLEILKNR